MPVKKLKEYLDKNGVKYMTINQSIAYTAQDIAASACIPGKELAKAVIFKADGKMMMAVLPASQKINFDLLKKSIGKGDITLAIENEFRSLFPECEIGAMPPFGNLYNMEVVVADTFAKNTEIAFNSGSHSELIRMSYTDFEKLVQPKVIRISEKLVAT